MKSDEKWRQEDSQNVPEASTDPQWNSTEADPSSPRAGEASLKRRNSSVAAPGTENAGGYARRFSVTADRLDDPSSGGPSPSRDVHRFQTRVNVGKVKLCGSCGSVMVRSTRMVLSPMAGIALILLGAAFMAIYGVAANFYQTPWYLKFGLPALYYVGSLFVGIGILFFFIREKVWKCYKCREIRKR